ncbi:MAG: hypothetical protein GXY24_02130 [Bacteroidales bacterium]|jgi:hypothetical protein|nr:hypothetical protein [Bacteroidales bacterium]
MNRRFLSICFLLFAGSLFLRAQDHPVQILDGPLMGVDSLQRRPELLPPMGGPVFPGIRMPSILTPQGYESKEQRAARVNAQVRNSLLNSIDYNLEWYRPPKLSKTARTALSIARLFLSNPYAFPEHAVPLMNHSFPFVYAIEPGMAPYDSPYSPEYFPQTVRTEYDFATGKYKQVMVPWAEFEMNMKRSFGGAYKPEAVPKIAVTPVEREMQRTGLAP